MDDGKGPARGRIVTRAGAPIGPAARGRVGSIPTLPTTEALTLVFATLPDTSVSVNHRGNLHWAVRSRQVKAEREKWGWLLISYRSVWEPWIALNPPPYALSIAAHVPMGRWLDADGAMSAYKPLLDAMTPHRVFMRLGRPVVSGGVGVIPGDGPAVLPEVTVRTVLRARVSKTVITLRRVGG